ncbi:helix-turn-helix transcriptional regulator, partial [Enterococcus faecalis]|uniref:helix-turn-helix transcriptional regulator n=1 Tax=Enterococcus faecalis TaxID=1351 RepID=UPI0040395572
ISSQVFALWIIDPEQLLAPSPELLKSLYQLTDTEIRLALSLFAGQTLNEAAKSFFVEKSTVRTQLAAIF